MQLSRPDGMRWVINGVSPETIRKVRMMAAQHRLYICEILDWAVEELWDDPDREVVTGNERGPADA